MTAASSETGDDPETHCCWVKAPDPKTPPPDLSQAATGFPETQGRGNVRHLWKVGANKAVFTRF